MIESYEFLSPLDGVHYICRVLWRCPECRSEGVIRTEKSAKAEPWTSIPFLLDQNQVWSCKGCQFTAAGSSFHQELRSTRRRYIGHDADRGRRSTAVARPLTELRRTIIKTAVTAEQKARGEPKQGRKRSPGDTRQISDAQWAELQELLDTSVQRLEEKRMVGLPLNGATREIVEAARALKQALSTCAETGGNWASEFLSGAFSQQLDKLSGISSKAPDWLDSEEQELGELQHDLDAWWKTVTSLPAAHRKEFVAAYEVYLEQVLSLVSEQLGCSASATKRRRSAYQRRCERDKSQKERLREALLKLRG